MTELELQSRMKLENLKAAILEATRLEGFDHVDPAVDRLVGHLEAYKYTDREFDVLMADRTAPPPAAVEPAEPRLAS